MKKIVVSVLGIALFFGITLQKVHAQIKVEAEFKATAEVIEALTATETAQLNFGRFAPNNQGGAIRISPSGNRNAIGSLALGGGTYHPASFYITGQSGYSLTITLPASAVLTNIAKAKTMTVSQWESDPPAGIGAGVLEGGSLAVNVGATLNVGSIDDNPVGVYSGTYAIVFAYN